MTRNAKLIYSWRRQIVCLVVAAGGIIAYVLTIPIDAGFFISTPVFGFYMPFFFLFLPAMGLIVVMPAISYRRRRKALHETASVCGRCEKELPPGSVIARFGNEFLCEECTRYMEAIRGEDLPKFNKPEGM